MAEEGDIMKFLANTKNAQRINGLVEDVHEALLEYLVCRGQTFSTMSDVRTRLRCNKISTKRVVGSL